MGPIENLDSIDLFKTLDDEELYGRTYSAEEYKRKYCMGDTGTHNYARIGFSFCSSEFAVDNNIKKYYKSILDDIESITVHKRRLVERDYQCKKVYVYDHYFILKEDNEFI
jgi:hypothetical protein